MKSHSSFNFKTFSIEQNSTVFKVGTDAVLLGAWLQDKIRINNVLEIGSGTGVISLCLFQKHKNALYTAIDSNIDAVNFTQINFQKNGMEKYVVSHNNFHNFFENQTSQFDLIFSNPPYFVNDLIAEKEVNIHAKHAINFDFNLFFKLSYQALDEKGKLALIFPSQSKNYLINLAKENKFNVEIICDVFSKKSKEANRFMILFSIEKVNEKKESICIYNEDSSYSSSYRELTKDFYLKF